LKNNLHAFESQAEASASPSAFHLEYVRVEETENNFFQCFDGAARLAAGR
jgi:hypothetical protein